MYLIDIEITESLDKPQQYSLNKKGKRGFQSINKNNEIIQVCVTLVSLVSRLFLVVYLPVYFQFSVHITILTIYNHHTVITTFHMKCLN